MFCLIQLIFMPFGLFLGVIETLLLMIETFFILLLSFVAVVIIFIGRSLNV